MGKRRTKGLKKFGRKERIKRRKKDGALEGLEDNVLILMYISCIVWFRTCSTSTMRGSTPGVSGSSSSGSTVLFTEPGPFDKGCTGYLAFLISYPARYKVTRNGLINLLQAMLC